MAKRGFLPGRKLACRLICHRHLVPQHDAVHRQIFLRAKVRTTTVPARYQCPAIEHQAPFHLAESMPRSAAGHRHVVTGQALGMLLNVLRDRLRKPYKARNRSAQSHCRLNGDQPQHRRLTPLGQTLTLRHQPRLLGGRCRLVASQPDIKLTQRIGSDSRPCASH